MASLSVGICPVSASEKMQAAEVADSVQTARRNSLHASWQEGLCRSALSNPILWAWRRSFSEADSGLNVLDTWQLIPQFLRQNAGNAVFADADRLGNIFEGVFRNQVVFRLAEQKPNGRVVIFGLHDSVHGREVEIELTDVLRLELAGFEFDHHIATQSEMIKEQIQIKIIAADIQMILVTEESKSRPQLQKQPRDLRHQRPLNVPLHHVLPEGDEVEHIGVLHHLLRELTLLRRKRHSEVVDLFGKRLPLIKSALDLMDKDVF